jgi:hypothetical protein
MAQPPVEVERKWLVHTPPDLPVHPGKGVTQGSIARASSTYRVGGKTSPTLPVLTPPLML